MSGYTVRTPNTVMTTLIQDGQAAGSITPQDARDLFASAMSAEPNTQTASYTLVLTDAWLCVEYNSSSAGNLLIPTDASVAFQIGTVIEWFQMGVGQLTIVAVTPGTTTVRNASSNTARTQSSCGAIRKRAVNDWVLLGDLT
jgi:hypothetical protein